MAPPSFPELAGRNAVVTGGAGFIGSRVVAGLVAAGATVTVVDDLRSGSGTNLPESGVRLVDAGLRGVDREVVLGGAEVVFHCAGSAYVPPSVERPLDDLDINLTMAVELLEWLRHHNPDCRVLLFSSAAVYGNPRHLPVDEEHPIRPISPYGVAKLAAERYGAVFAGLYGLPVASLRCFSVYGPRQHKQVVFDLMSRMRAGQGRLDVLGDGSQVRDFCYVDDVAAAALTVAARAPMRGEEYNVGSGQGTSIGELVVAIGAALGLDPQPNYSGAIRPGDAEAWVADCSRLRKLGWAPATSLPEGLRATATWQAQLGEPPASSR